MSQSSAIQFLDNSSSSPRLGSIFSCNCWHMWSIDQLLLSLPSLPFCQAPLSLKTTSRQLQLLFGSVKPPKLWGSDQPNLSATIPLRQSTHTPASSKGCHPSFFLSRRTPQPTVPAPQSTTTALGHDSTEHHQPSGGFIGNICTQRGFLMGPSPVVHATDPFVPRTSREGPAPRSQADQARDQFPCLGAAAPRRRKRL